MTVETQHNASGAAMQPPRSVLERIARALAVAGGCLMLGAALMVTVSIMLRWLRNDGIQGDFEMVQIATALAVFFFMPLCQWGRGNVFVDTFTLKAPDWFNRGLDVLWDLVFAGLALFIGWRLSLGAMDAISSRTGSMVLGIPFGWAILVCSLLAVFLGLLTLATAWRRLKGAS